MFPIILLLIAAHVNCYCNENQNENIIKFQIIKGEIYIKTNDNKNITIAEMKNYFNGGGYNYVTNEIVDKVEVAQIIINMPQGLYVGKITNGKNEELLNQTLEWIKTTSEKLENDLIAKYKIEKQEDRYVVYEIVKLQMLAIAKQRWLENKLLNNVVNAANK